MLAIQYYIRAARLDSPTASILLYKMKIAGKFFPLIKTMSDENNLVANFDWYGLEVLGYDQQIVFPDAVKLLKKSVDQFSVPAMIEYGLALYSGLISNQSKGDAFTIWQKAAQLGSGEAATRINAAIILDQLAKNSYKEHIDELFKASEKGSVLAQAAIGFAYENGLGVELDKAKAVKYYREAAQRGNRFSSDRLKYLYDEIRPSDSEFKTN